MENETIEVQDKKIIFGSVRKVGDDVDETRTITFEASNGSKDRHKSILNVDGWEIKAFNDNPIVGYQHNVYGDDFCNPPDPDDVIGKAKVYMEDKKLMADVTFEGKENNPKAEKIFQKVKNGFLKAVSVGFLPVGESRIEIERDKEGNEVDRTEFFDGQELLEISIVNIPSNRTALKKDFRDAAARAIHFIKRQLPEFNYSEIENMRLADILALVKGEMTVKEYKDLSNMDFETKAQEIKREFEESVTLDYRGILNQNLITLNGNIIKTENE